MKFRNTRWAVVLATLAVTAPGAAIAAEPLSEAAAPSKEQRVQMANAHEKMAACLRSDRSFQECRQEMHTSCAKSFGDRGCPMMDEGRRMRDRPMKRPPPEKPDAQ